MAKGVVYGAKKVSVRKAPWDPLNDSVLKEKTKGDTIIVDSNRPCYDWKGHVFYPLIEGGITSGYIRSDAVKLHATTVVRKV
jgi:hypothetical protein